MVSNDNCICCDAPEGYNGHTRFVEWNGLGLLGPFCGSCIYSKCHLRKEGTELGHWIHRFSWQGQDLTLFASDASG